MAPDESGEWPVAAERDEPPEAPEPDGPDGPDGSDETTGSAPGAGSGPGAELRALFASTRATVLLFVTAGLVVLSAWGVTRIVASTPMGFQDNPGLVRVPEIVQILSSAAVVGALGPLLLGALAGPLVARRRDEVASSLGAKAIAHAVLGLVYGAVAVLLVAGTILVVAGFNDVEVADLTSPDVLRAVLGILVAYPLWAVIGVGVGALAGSPAVAASAVLLWPYFESALRNVANAAGSIAPVTQYLPVQVTGSLATGGYQGATLALSPINMITAVLVLVAWTAVFLGAGAVATMARLPAPERDEPADDGLEPEAPVPDPI